MKKQMSLENMLECIDLLDKRFGVKIIFECPLGMGVTLEYKPNEDSPNYRMKYRAAAQRLAEQINNVIFDQPLDYEHENYYQQQEQNEIMADIKNIANEHDLKLGKKQNPVVEDLSQPSLLT